MAKNCLKRQSVLDGEGQKLSSAAQRSSCEPATVLTPTVDEWDPGATVGEYPPADQE